MAATIEIKSLNGTVFANFKQFNAVDAAPYTTLHILPPMSSPAQKKTVLLAETATYEQFWKSFDLTAFPLPLRVAPWESKCGTCWICAGHALHIHMRILPRSADELHLCQRDPDGKLELNTCTQVTPDLFSARGPENCLEVVRETLKNMALHELYEALMFRGFRIFDPHDPTLKPRDQAF